VVVVTWPWCSWCRCRGSEYVYDIR